MNIQLFIGLVFLITAILGKYTFDDPGSNYWAFLIIANVWLAASYLDKG